MLLPSCLPGATLGLRRHFSRCHPSPAHTALPGCLPACLAVYTCSYPSPLYHCSFKAGKRLTDYTHKELGKALANAADMDPSDMGKRFSEGVVFVT